MLLNSSASARRSLITRRRWSSSHSSETGRKLGRVAMAARVRRGAHAVVEDALGRCLAQIEPALAQEPLLVGQIERAERRAQRLDPGVVFVDDVALRHVREPSPAVRPRRRPSVTRYGGIASRAEGTRSSTLMGGGNAGAALASRWTAKKNPRDESRGSSVARRRKDRASYRPSARVSEPAPNARRRLAMSGRSAFDFRQSYVRPYPHRQRG